jgi:hypothetical protein
VGGYALIKPIDDPRYLDALSFLPMHDSGRSRAGTRSRIATLIASLLAAVLVFASVAAAAVDSNLLRTGSDQGPLGASIESGDSDPLPFAKLAEEVAGEGSGDAESDTKDFADAALSQIDLIGSALLRGSIGVWECPPPLRSRARLGHGARGPPVV